MPTCIPTTAIAISDSHIIDNADRRLDTPEYEKPMPAAMSITSAVDSNIHAMSAPYHTIPVSDQPTNW